MGLIEFHGSEPAMRDYPRPHPAKNAVPDWYKAMPPDFQRREDQPTLKRCPPFLEAMTAGYIIPVPGDCGFSIAKNQCRISSSFQLIEGHHDTQVRGTPFERATVLKFINPWIVTTPPGYSCWFLAPANRPDLPLSFFSGIVETDRYYRAVHFPFLLRLGEGQSFKLTAGSPLMQVVPVLRGAWESRHVHKDEQRAREAELELAANPHAYKDGYWEKRECS